MRMSSQPMELEVSEEVQALIAMGLVEVVAEDSQPVPTAAEEPPAEAPTAEEPAVATAAGEGASVEVAWLEQCSKHLHHIEGRLMEAEFMGHEVVRQIGILLDTMSPPPRGGLGVVPEAIPGHLREDVEAIGREVRPAWRARGEL